MSNRFVQTAVSCASCGKVRGESNHWFVMCTIPLEGAEWTAGGAIVLYAVTRLVSAPASENEFPACGESCLQKLESKLLYSVKN